MSDNKAVDAIVDKHLKAMMEDLEEIDVSVLGAVVGVLQEHPDLDEIYVSWCVSDGIRGDGGEIVPVKKIVREIAVAIERTTAE